MSEAAAIDPEIADAQTAGVHKDLDVPQADPRAILSRRLAWAGWTAAIVMNLVGLGLLAATGFREIPGSYGFPGFTAPFAFSFGTVGAFVLSRRPGNRVGQILLLTGVFAGFQTLYTAYAIYGALAYPGSLPFAVVAGWLLSWAWIPFMFLAGPTLLSIFPDGRLVVPQWRPILGASAAVAGVVMVANALRVGPIQNFSVFDNPFGVIPGAVAEPIIALGFGGISAAIIAAAISMVVRFRRADEDRRQQIKWFAVAGVILALATPWGFFVGKPGQALFLGAVALLPIATGIAVLRYGLYEIDNIINRAIVYGLLTALLAGLYAASVGFMQRISRLFTGADSDAAIVLTTLIVVTAFTPIKTRLQDVVDRRFKGKVDPRARIQAFMDELDARMWPLDVDRMFARFLAVALEVTGASGGRIEVHGQSDSREATAGSPDGATIWISGASGPTTVRLGLSQGPGLRRTSDLAITAIEAALARLAAEVTTASRAR